jgi:phage terminase large subunit-like protein
VLIEDKASGTQLIQERIAEGCHAVARYQPSGDKTMRMHAQTNDGYVAANIAVEEHWHNLLKVMGREDLCDDPRFGR